MRDGLLLCAALLSSVVGFAWLALAMETHWRQATTRSALTSRFVIVLRTSGALALVLSLWLCLEVDHATIATLVWVMTLAVAALLVTCALAFRPKWVGKLAAHLPS